MDYRDDNSWSSCHHSYSDNCHFSCKYFPPYALWFLVLHIFNIIISLEAITLWSRKPGVVNKADVSTSFTGLSSAYQNFPFALTLILVVPKRP